MANETKSKEDKKESKHLLVIFAVVILVAAGLYFVSNSYSRTNSSDSMTQDSSTQTPTGADTELTSKKWMWVKTQMSDGAETLPSAPGKFALTFQTDMRLIANTDCNNGNGSYELGADNAMTIGPMATTMMFCEGSTETQFFQGLSNVGSYKISDGQLWLMLKMDSGTMIFE